MICDQDQRAVGVGGFDIFYAEDIHQIVGREVDPKRTDVSLKERPEPLPGAGVHAMGKPETERFGRAEHRDLLGRGQQG